MKKLVMIIDGEEKEEFAIPIDDTITDDDIDWYIYDE